MAAQMTLAVRLGAVENRQDNFVTKEALDAAVSKVQDAISKMEVRILKWYVGTLLVAGSLVFTAASFFR